MNAKQLDEKYPYIRKWGRMMGSDGYYITRQQESALADKAPENATYKNSHGTWNTTDDVSNLDTRRVLNLPMREIDELRAEGYRLWDQLSRLVAPGMEQQDVASVKRRNQRLKDLIAGCIGES